MSAVPLVDEPPGWFDSVVVGVGVGDSVVILIVLHCFGQYLFSLDF